MKKPVGQVIRISSERGVARILNGQIGMLFIVENWVGVEDRCAAVLDYRYPQPEAVGGYQCWTIPEDGFEIIREAPTEISSETPATGPLEVTMDIPWDAVANAWVGVTEGPYSPWLHRIDPGKDDMSATLKRAIDLSEAGPWYAEGSYWRDGGFAVLKYDTPEDDEGEGSGVITVGPVAIRNGLNIMAAKCATHFADLVNENDDAITHDVLIQCIVFGEIIYG